jgi:hypothetical protein
MNTALEYSTIVVQEGGRRCKKSTLNDLVHLTPLRIPLMNPPTVLKECVDKVKEITQAYQQQYISEETAYSQVSCEYNRFRVDNTYNILVYLYISRQSANIFSSRWNWDSPTPSPAGECASQGWAK